MQLMHDANNGMVLKMMVDDFINPLFRLDVINAVDMLALCS
jgi:hypothetical protein